MELLMDPSIWVGLLTLVVLEIVLGIDNLVFIAILADKLPPKQRDKARLIGLSRADYASGAAVHYFVAGDLNKAALYRLGFYLLRPRFNYAAGRYIPAV